MRHLQRHFFILSLSLLLGAASATGAQADLATPLSPNPGGNNNLFAVSATSATDAWAVGFYRNETTHIDDTLILHWNGERWSQFKSPNPGKYRNRLSGVSAVSRNDAWAVGVSNFSAGAHSIILHWNGTAWSRVKIPRSYLSGVSADSATDAWAVGDKILHWDGTAWSRVKSPNPGRGNILFGVSADSATDAWAVGRYRKATTHADETLILHWNGATWSRVEAPSPGAHISELDGVSADSATDAWAVGYYQNAPSRDQRFHPLILHWNGTVWSRVKSPNPGAHSLLNGVSALTRTGAWAVGFSCPPAGCNAAKSLILHWDGTAWSRVKSPSPGDTSPLFGTSALSGTDAWAAGSYYDGNIFNTNTLTLHWNGTSWSRT
jgi:hypothetical protein